MTNLCPICSERPVDPAYKPFCSKRCADVDLQRWFAGVYRVPGEDAADDESGPRGEDED
jgi:endogenous inhibitor of DNA gyrase (YacG/DUF329 family)